MSLNNLGNRLASLGHREEALQATQNAVDLYRKLVQDCPDAYVSNLAGSLNNLGKLLVEMRRSDEALPIFAELLDSAPVANTDVLIRRTVPLAIRLAARGFGARVLTTTEASPAAPSLEPLTVALHRYLGQETHAPLEIDEIAKDLLKEIEAIKVELERKENQTATGSR
jgi:tetratricopeptide (TPR) repeat protein